VRILRTRVGAALVAGLCIAGLAVLAAPVSELRGGLPFVTALPSDSPVERAARVAGENFVPGVLSPTLVEVRPAGPAPADALQRLEDTLRKQPHVAAVLGPGEDAAISAAAGRAVGAFVRPDRTAARYLVLLDVDPLDATGVDAVRDLGRRMPQLMSGAGLERATAGIGGDTAAIAAVVDQTSRDLQIVLIAALVVNLLLLIVFLRALIAPLFLLGCTVLSAAATFGLTVWVFQDELGHPGVTFFVPLATGVLLIALGSDYNLFAIGHVWNEARRQRLKDAMLTALPRSSGAITVAGVALAASLGALALVPLRQFRELAFALVVGILIDALLVRTLLAPALLGLFGRFSGWPGRRLEPPDPAPAPARDDRGDPPVP
jgi:putative drug exporter of the RND superfamily